MRRRGRQGKFSLIGLFVVIFAFWWGISVLSQNGAATPADAALPASASSAYAPQNITSPLALNVMQKGTVYTYAGSVPLSSSCDQLSTGIAVHGSNPTHITILLTVTKPLVACVGTSGTNTHFSVSLSVKAGTQAVFDNLMLNGSIVPTALQVIKTK